jgi:CBS domain-containing protein
MILAVFTSKTISDWLTNGLFDREIRDEQMPMLKGVCPPQTAQKKAYQIMSKSLITVQSIADMRSVSQALSSDHNGFPVLNTAGNLVGIMPKNVLNSLILQKSFYETRRLSIASRA